MPVHRTQGFGGIVRYTWPEARALFQYRIRRLIIRSHEVSKPWDRKFKSSHRFEIWQAHRQQCCRGACQISERSDNSKYKSRGIDSRDLMIRRLTDIETGPRFLTNRPSPWVPCPAFCIDLNLYNIIICVQLNAGSEHLWDMNSQTHVGVTSPDFSWPSAAIFLSTNLEIFYINWCRHDFKYIFADPMVFENGWRDFTLFW